MAQKKTVSVPITCGNGKCSNFGNLINCVTELVEEDIDLFYEGYDGSDSADYCPLCNELGVAEDYWHDEDWRRQFRTS